MRAARGCARRGSAPRPGTVAGLGGGGKPGRGAPSLQRPEHGDPRRVPSGTPTGREGGGVRPGPARAARGVRARRDRHLHPGRAPEGRVSRRAAAALGERHVLARAVPVHAILRSARALPALAARHPRAGAAGAPGRRRRARVARRVPRVVPRLAAGELAVPRARAGAARAVPAPGAAAPAVRGRAGLRSQRPVPRPGRATAPRARAPAGGHRPDRHRASHRAPARRGDRRGDPGLGARAVAAGGVGGTRRDGGRQSGADAARGRRDRAVLLARPAGAVLAQAAGRPRLGTRARVRVARWRRAARSCAAARRGGGPRRRGGVDDEALLRARLALPARRAVDRALPRAFARAPLRAGWGSRSSIRSPTMPRSSRCTRHPRRRPRVRR